MELPSYPATARNREPISKILGLHLPKYGEVLETASGTGEHICFFGRRFPFITWQPSDKSENLFWAIRERVLVEENVKNPFRLDLAQKNFKGVKNQYAGVLNINMIHIAPWKACVGLFCFAQRLITSDGFVYLYGPYKIGGAHTSESNEQFDVSLKDQNPDWGVRNLEDVVELAKRFGFCQSLVYEMPANNKSIIFRRK